MPIKHLWNILFCWRRFMKRAGKTTIANKGETIAFPATVSQPFDKSTICLNSAAVSGDTERRDWRIIAISASFGSRSEERRVGKECAERLDLGGRRII